MSIHPSCDSICGLSRRDLALGAASLVLGARSPAHAAPPEGTTPTICIFSKHLQHLTDYDRLARQVQELQIPAVDLTVRPGGHVLPENVARYLPLAVGALDDQGIAVPMITTNLLTAADPAARPTLETAARLGVPYFKPGYYRYADGEPLDQKLDEVKRSIEGLARLAEQTGIVGGFHNHSGTYVGSSMWDHWWAMRDAAPEWMGFYFDPCHATIEGGRAGWELGFRRLAGRIRMIAIKDFRWEKSGEQWVPQMCPMGEGMVNFPKFFEMLASTGFDGPISLHLEYSIEGRTEAARNENLLAAVERDFQFLRRQVEAAFP